MSHIVKTKQSLMLKIFTLSIITISLLYATQFVLDDDQFAFVSTPSYIIIPGVLAGTSIYIAIKEWKNNTKNKIAICVLLACVSFVCYIFDFVFKTN